VIHERDGQTDRRTPGHSIYRAYAYASRGNKIHTHGASSSSAPLLQLKSKLAAFCHLNRSVNTALSAGNANCCLVAQCLYVPLANTSEPKTSAQRKRASSQNAELRQSEQLLDTSRRKVCRQDDNQRQQEQQRDTSKHRTRRQCLDYRQHF